MSASSDTKPTLLIIGAGFGGLSVCKRLEENGGIDKFRIVLVDAKSHFTMGGLWQFVWNQRLSMQEIQWPLKDAFDANDNIELRTNTTVSKWNVVDKNVVVTSAESNENEEEETILSYDYIVLACGVVPDPTSIPGLEQHVNVCTMETVDTKQREGLEELAEKAKTSRVTFCYVISTNPYKCPPAPFELTFLVDEYLRNKGVRDNCTLQITCPVDWPMPPPFEQPFHDQMNAKNIEFLPEHVVDNIDGDGTIHCTNGVEIETDLIWSSWPIRAPDFVRDAIPVNPKGFVTVENKVTNTIPNVEHAHVVGDCCTVPFGARFALPKAGEFAWRMGMSVADALIDQIGLADRSGDCVAETGFGQALVLHPNFSNVINDPVNGKPKVSLDPMESGGEQGKIDWANGYVTKIFGIKARLLSLKK